MLEQLANSDLSLITYLIIMAGGLVSGLSPCALPTVLLIVGYVGGRESVSRLRGFYLSLAFVLGISICLSILGMTASLAGGLFLGNRFIWYAVAVITIVMGLSMLGLLNFNLSTNINIKPGRNGSVISAFLLGFPFGLAASPCTTPVTVTVLAFAAAKGSVSAGFLMLFLFAMGRSLPLLAAGTFTGLIKNIDSFTRVSALIQKISGVLLIGLGFYFLWTTL